MILVALVILLLAAVANALPLAYFGMLFLGAIGVNFSFTTSLLGALAVKFATSSIIDPGKE